MSARTILAVRTGRTKFKGVFHEHGSEPWILGDHLLSRVIRARGDLTKVVEEIINAAPWGWVNLQKGEQSTLKKQPNRRLFSQNILAKRAEIELDWVYVFDLDERTLTISAAAEVGPSGLAEAPYAHIAFNERGRPEPRQIVPPPPPWPEHPVAEGWEGDLDGLATLRQRALAVTDAWCEQVALPPENLSTLIGAALSSLVSKALGGEHENVYVPAPRGEGQLYWSVEIYDTTLHYPAPQWRELLREHGEMYAPDTIVVWGGVNNEGTVSLTPTSIVEGYDDFPWSDDLPDQEATVAAVLRGLAAGIYPRSDIDSDDLRIFRWMTVVEAVEDPDREVRVSAANDQEVGAEVQNTLLLKWGWDVIDWLRASQIGVGDVPEEEAEPVDDDEVDDDEVDDDEVDDDEVDDDEVDEADDDADEEVVDEVIEYDEDVPDDDDFDEVDDDDDFDADDDDDD